MSDMGVVQAELAELDRLASELGSAAAALIATAVGADTGPLPVPEDEHGVARKLVELLDARERADQRIADALHTVGQRLAVVGLAVRQADVPVEIAGVAAPAAGSGS